MKRILGELFVRLIGPIHSLFMRLWAYGPWGPLHQWSILVFKNVYGIKWGDTSKFKTLGDFFLREVPYQVAPSALVSPVQARLIDGPRSMADRGQTHVKGLTYAWDQMPELKNIDPTSVLWNLYLAPYDYHWVHSSCSGKNLRAYRHRGKRWPVNALGRWLCPNLYQENDRVTFQWENADFGLVTMICVGAMGVSSLYSLKGPVPCDQWTPLGDGVSKAEKLLAFELGSTVLMLIQKPPASLSGAKLLNVGDAL